MNLSIQPKRVIHLLRAFAFVASLVLGVSSLSAGPDASVEVTIATPIVSAGDDAVINVIVLNGGDDPFSGGGDSITFDVTVSGLGTQSGSITSGLDIGSSETQTFTFPSFFDITPGAVAVTATITTATRDTNPTNHVATTTITFVVPDLGLENLTVPANAVAGEDVSVTFGINNNSTAPTDPAKFFPVEAILWTVPPGLSPIERQYLLFKQSIEGNEAVSGQSIGGLRIPATALPGDQFRVEVTIDPSPSTISDSNPANNRGEGIITVGGTADVKFVPGSFIHEEGTFFSGDPIQMGLEYRNEGDATVPAGTAINIRIALSRDNNGMISQDDFVFRTIDATSDRHGNRLLPGETVSEKWVQTLPEGYQGNFFVLTEIDGNVMSGTASPSLTIHSRAQPETLHVSSSEPPGGTLSDAASVSLNGQWIAYEVLVNGISQIYLKPGENDPVAITGGNQGSFAPCVSGNGQFVVFHSYASNLVADDFNKMPDIFIYNWALNRITKITKSQAGAGANGGSYYPKVDANGTTVVFESLASNLGEDPNPYFHDIFVYDSIKKQCIAITYPHKDFTGSPEGPLDSFQAGISLSGKRVVFTSFASNLIAGLDVEDFDTNGASDVFLWEAEKNETTRISLTLDNYAQIEGNSLGDLGHSSEPVISGDGKYVAFYSVGQNLFSSHGPGKGIVEVKLTASGAGYGIAPIVSIKEGSLVGTGSGAIAVAGINSNGEVVDINVTSPGSGYLEPIVEIDQAPNDNVVLGPDAKAAALAYLSHPEGELYLADVDKIIHFEEDAIVRISERYVSADPGASVGGNGYSRQASINYDGSLIAYRTEASNLLTEQVKRADGKTFYNKQSRRAIGQLILGGSITEIEIGDPGFGYSSGSMSISDSSGAGTGARADYEVDGYGRIVSIIVVDPGTGYDPTTTEVTVQGVNNTFKAGAIRHSGSILRVELTDEGLGYPKTAENKLPDEFTLEIDGDGIDAKMNHNMIRVGPSGELLLIQKATLTLASLDTLDDATLTLYESAKSAEGSFTITFVKGEPPVWNLGLKIIGFSDATSATELIDNIKGAIDDNWKEAQDPMEGLKATKDETTGSLLLEGINGQFTTSAPNALSILYASNLLVQGSGYATGTVSIGPDPVIYGYSEISQDFTLDDLSSDIYLFYREGMGSVQARENERVSVSSFGYPVRSFGEPSAPSSRSPALSGDGRFVVFSTDADGPGGILFDPDGSNQSPTPLALSRNILMHDRKIALVLDENATHYIESSATPSISLVPELGVLDENGTRLPSLPWVEGTPYHVVAKLKDPYDKLTRVELLVNNQVESTINLEANSTGFVFNRVHLTWSKMEQGEHSLLVRGYDDLNNRYVSETQTIYVREKNDLHQLPEPLLSQPENGFTLTTTSSIYLNAMVTDEDGYATKMTFYLDGKSFQEAVEANSTEAINEKLDETLTLYPSLDGKQRTSSRWPKPDANATIATLQVVATDNHGNITMSEPTTVSVVEGTETGSITLVQPPKNVTVRPVKDEVRIAEARIEWIQSLPPTFEILALSITDPGIGYVKPPKVVVWGSGADAELEASIDTDPFSDRFGQVTELKIVNGGRGYVFNNTTVHFIGGHDIEPVLIEANATHPDEIKGVSFIIDGVKSDLNGDLTINDLDVDHTSPYLMNRKFYPGKHDVYVLARDVHNNVYASEVSELNILTATGVRPQANIEYPVDMGWDSDRRIPQDVTTNSNVPIHIRVYDGDGVDNETGLEDPGSIKEVGLYLDEQRFATLGKADRMPNTFIYRYDWQVLGVDRGPYELSAVVIDHDGNYIKTEPRPIEIIASGTSKPELQFIGPRTEEEVFSVGSKVTMTARAVQTGFPIKEIDFFANGELITKTSTPLAQMADVYHFAGVWEPETAGSYLLQAVVYDTNGSRVASEFRKVTTFSSSGGSLPPEITMMYPKPDQSFTSTSVIRLEAEAKDVDGSLEGVQFYVNGANGWVQFLEKAETGDRLTLTYDNNETYEFDFNETVPLAPLADINTTSVWTGTTIKESRDNLLLAMQAKIYSEGLPLELTAYEDQTIRLNFDTNESVQLLVQLNNNDNPKRISFQAQILAEVDPPAFTLDGYPFGMSWTPGLPGTYVIYAVVRDNSGNRVMSDPVAITSTHGDNYPPKVTLLAPADGSIVNVNTKIVLHAVASDKGEDGVGIGDPGYQTPDEGEGLINELEFFVNGKSVASNISQLDATGRVATAEYVPTEPGVYDFYAVVKDDSGNTVFTPANRVNTYSFQLPQQPGIKLVFPTNNFNLTVSSKIRLYCALTDPYGTMDHVKFSVMGGGSDVAEELEMLTNDAPGPNELAYGLDWTPATTGTYVITAEAVDEDKNSTLVSSPAYVIVGDKGTAIPTVEILLPTPKWSEPGILHPQSRVTLLAQVDSNDSKELAQEVSFYRDGDFLGSGDTNNTEGLFQYTYEVPASAVTGPTEIYAVVKDASGDWNVSDVKQMEITKADPVDLPGVALDFAGNSLTSISNLSITDNSKLRIYAQAADTDGRIVGVQFYVNGSNGWIQFLENPKVGDAVTIALNNSSKKYIFGDDVALGGTMEESLDNLLKIIEADGDIEAVKHETHTILLNFPDFPTDKLTTSADERLAALVFSTQTTSMTGQVLPESLLGDYVYREGHPFAVDWTPGLLGNYTVYAVARDNSKNKTMSAPLSLKVSSPADNTPVVKLGTLSKTRLINESLFLSADIEFSNPSASATEIQEVQFLINGVALGNPDAKSPYYTTWTPTDYGHYEVIAYALDNQGNVVFSNLETVDILGETVPTFGFTSIDGILTGQAKMPEVQITRRVKTAREAFRRSGTFSNALTEIYGVNTKYMTELIPGQKIVFAEGSEYSDVYTVAEIVSDNNLTIEESLSDFDYKFMTEDWEYIEIVEVYRSGSWIFLAAGQDENPAKLDHVDFYVDGQLHFTDNDWPFNTGWIPVDTGNYTLIAVAVDNNGVETIAEKRVTVLKQVGQLPDGATYLVPEVTRPGSFTRGSHVVAIPKIVDLDDGVNRVEFYLNGKFHKVDYNPPFYCIFMPDSSAPLRLTDRLWELTMVAIDNDGNRISLTQDGTVAGSVQLPVATVTHPENGDEYTPGQIMSINVEVTGFNLQDLVGPASTAQPVANQPRQMALFANGEEIGMAKETAFGSGQFAFDWSVKNEVARNDGKVDLFGVIVMTDENVGGLNFTPSIVSDAISITLKEKNPLGDAKSAISQFYKDLLFYEPSEEDVEIALATTGSGTPGEYITDDPSFLEWASGLIQRQSFKDLVNAVAGHRTIIGQWPSHREMVVALQTYSAIPNYGTDGSIDSDGDGYSLNQETLWQTSDTNATDYPDNAFRLGSYLDMTFSSPAYLRYHGKIGSLSGDSKEASRRDFVSLLYGNKYREEPTLQQQIQGSHRLKTLDPNQQQQNNQQNMMMQQMMMMAMMGGGFGNNNNNNNNTPTVSNYKNDDGAILFTTNMVLEQQIESLDLLWNAPSSQNEFQTAAAMLALWQDNLTSFDQAEINKYSSMPWISRVQAMVKDSRYLSRFRLSISRDAEIISTAPDWKYLPWLGYYNDRGFPWIYHQALGWIYVQAPDTTDIWLYISDIGWVWTKDTLVSKLPTIKSTDGEIWSLTPLYDASSESWLFYVPDHKEADIQNKFYDTQNEVWIQR